MKVLKWGDSLAIRLPADMVQSLQLREGDTVDVIAADAQPQGVGDSKRDSYLACLRQFRGKLPADFKFCRS
ncbi:MULTISPECIES: AbrB/MazE/SpoVT family DNA-binding domain-containing protein [Paraburkholderia]|jgi:antitoxin MazE|uniref:AbrB/MazE/SpoVT family DNA-binding domain-containing protein n=1 Tax=Paraburkholderia TaxID=1822464 RepID=UPI0015C558CF|nr:MULTISPECIES: AbrB/MazE/SpoVT family DNA-binding domain-containing protein [Paraburkholderia]MCX4172486.1 AbrB/MazE/SpoVT family DNA-binding domain-containing protein [Paraburkholderia madseniana]MDQ6460495.1 AbrB/MazE/SpoVT family DNA-binding domain-containing protein [Paraburkholderia madseniana]NPT64134.1 AbrB/MazE/SpoVT family DNA-binding domain-containing protein [Paraburkholderia madseniana]